MPVDSSKELEVDGGRRIASHFGITWIFYK